MVPQVAEIWYRPGAAFERTVPGPKRCHGWWPSGFPFSAPMSRTGECTTPRLSRHATSSDTAEPGGPCAGDTLNQLTPRAGGVSSKSVEARLDGELGSLGPEQATVSTPTLTIATKIRTLMSAQYAALRAACTADAHKHP